MKVNWGVLRSWHSPGKAGKLGKHPCAGSSPNLSFMRWPRFTNETEIALAGSEKIA